MDLVYMANRVRLYKEEAESSGSWRDYLKAHHFANTCLREDQSEDSRRLPYEIEESWYGGDHPLSYEEHQQLIDNHEQLLEKHREETRKNFDTLAASVDALDNDDVFSDKNLGKAQDFSKKVFAASKKCSEGLVSVSNCILQASVDVLKRNNEDAPCKFTIIGLCSMTHSEASHYSELEYAIIVAKKSDYFERLAVDSYFRMENLRGRLLESLHISAYQTHNPQGPSVSAGGTTEASGNISPGRGSKGVATLILTVEELMDLYKTEAEKPFDKLPRDTSDKLSSTIVLLSNEDEQDSNSLYKQFISARHSYEESLLENMRFVQKKRLYVLANVMQKCSLLPNDISFSLPTDLDIRIKEDIFEYATLLAHNLNICFGLTCCHSWEVYSELRQRNLLSSKNCQYLNILLALSIYRQKSEYLKRKSMSEASQSSSSTAQTRLAVLMGCLLIPVLIHMKSKITQLLASFDTAKQLKISSILENINVSKEDFWVKAEAFYLVRQYDAAKDELSKALGETLDSISISSCFEMLGKTTSTQFAELIHRELIRKRKEMCAYLLYYTKNYKRALEYFNYLVQEQGHLHWKWLAACCCKEIGDYMTGLQLLREVNDEENLLEASGSSAKEKAFYGEDSNPTAIAIRDSNTASVFASLSDYRLYLKYYKKSLDTQKAIHGEGSNHASIATSYSNIGSVYASIGDYSLSLNYYEKSLAMQKAIYGEDRNHASIATSYSNIGSAHASLGHCSLSLEYYLKSLEMQKAIYGKQTNHADIAINYHNIGSAYASIDNHRLSMDFYMKSLEMQKAIYGEDTDHPDMAAVLHKIGSTYASLGDGRKSLDYYTKSLDMQKSFFGEGACQLSIADCHNSMGSAYAHLGDYQLSLECYTKSLDMQKAIYGGNTNNADIANSYSNIGSAHTFLRNYQLALENYMKSLAMQKAIYGEDSNHTSIATSYSSIGSAYASLGDYRLSLEYYIKALDLRKAMKGEDSKNTDIATSYSNIAKVHENMKNPVAALECYSKVLKMQESIYGSAASNLHIAESCSRIGDTYSQLGEYSMSVRYHLRSLQIRLKKHQSYGQQQGVAGCYSAIAKSYHQSGNSEEALKNYQNALKIYQSLKDADSRKSLSSCYSQMGDTYSQTKDFKMSLEYYKNSLDILESIYGTNANHLEIAACCGKMAVIYSNLGQYLTSLEYHTRALTMRQSLVDDNSQALQSAVHSEVLSIAPSPDVTTQEAEVQSGVTSLPSQQEPNNSQGEQLEVSSPSLNSGRTLSDSRLDTTAHYSHSESVQEGGGAHHSPDASPVRTQDRSSEAHTDPDEPCTGQPAQHIDSEQTHSTEADEPSTPVIDKPIPTELSSYISRLCKEHSVESAILVQDPDEPTHLIIVGMNASSLEPCLPDIKEKYPDFDVRIHNKENILYTLQKTRLKATRLSPDGILADNWTMEGEDQATIEMLVKADDMTNDEIDKPVSTYAVVPAHMVMTDRQKEQFLSHTATIKMNREDIEGQTTRRRYSICVDDDRQLYEMKHPPVFCYRHWFEPHKHCQPPPSTIQPGEPAYSRYCVVDEECRHLYMNDVALLLVKNKRKEQIQSYLESNEPGRVARTIKEVSSLADLRYLHVQEEKRERRIAVKHLSGYMINVTIKTLDESRGFTEHIRFRLDPDSKGTIPTLEAGDCGCIVYLENRNGMYQPFGLFVGSFDCPLGKPVYQAIVLHQAFQDLESDYPHRVKDIRLYRHEGVS